MNFYIYRITNEINGKYYLGRRSCKCNPSKDSYMGSGKVLKLAIEKYGLENFSKEILCFAETAEELIEYESAIVDRYEVNNPMCYNLILGGAGTAKGKATFKGKKHNKEARRKMSKSLKGKAKSSSHKENIRKGCLGRVFSDETKNKIRIKALEREARKRANS